ncbi:LPS O-antigen chain length determinant protein WzzB [Aeromonas enteropelogenes]|uniref:LPS O-antigen chain length determinant protein WzzB n=1 Tax=Aeromonas enteropelogenes TaxID=29489 RepID=UPI003B9E3883
MMTDKDKNSSPIVMMSHEWQVASQDETDLRELVMELWRQKILIVITTILVASLGMAYALLAPQVWTSQALISEPSIEQVNAFQLRMDQLKNSIPPESADVMDFSTLQRPALYQSFVAAFNSMNNKRAFLIEQGIFAEELKREGVTDRRGERALMSKLGSAIVARPYDKISTDITLSFSAETAELAQQRLVKYIKFIQKKQNLEKNAELKTLLQNRIKALTSQYENIKADTLQTRQDDIRRTQYSLRISQAAGVEKPLERIKSDDVFNIDLGSKGLAEKLKILEEIKNPEVLNQELSKIRLQLSGLKSLKITNADFQSFKMIDSPEEPFSRDKPKRPLIMVLATLLGGLLGVGIALMRHAFRRPEGA